MKLATYKDGSRDGQLVVVSRDLHTAHFAAGIATRMQQVLDDWNFLSPQLQDLSTTLNQGKARHAFPFDPRQCMAPLPRAFHWSQAPLGADAPVAHTRPADDPQGATDAAWFGSARWGIRPQAALVAVCADLEMGASDDQGLDAIRLLMLANAWRLDQPPGAADHAPVWPAGAFAPVALTPDELGGAWHQGRLSAELQLRLGGAKRSTRALAAAELPSLGALIAPLTRTRRLRAGSLVGVDLPMPVVAGREGPHLALGDTLHLTLATPDGDRPFGALEQAVTGPGLGAADAGSDGGDPALDAALAADETAAQAPAAEG